MGAPSVDAITSRSARRGPSWAMSRRLPNSARSIALPAIAPISRPAIAPAGPNIGICRRQRRPLREQVRPSADNSRKSKNKASRRRHHGAIATSVTAAPSCACTIRVGAVTIAACLAGRLARQRNSSTSPGAKMADGTATRWRIAARRATPLRLLRPSRARKAALVPARRRSRRARHRAPGRGNRSRHP